MKLRSIIVILIIMLVLSSNVYAFSFSDIISQAETAISLGKSKSSGRIDTKQLDNVSSELYNILLGVGTGIAVIVGAILGIQYMIAGISKKVQVKEALVAYTVSCIVLFGGFGIWKLVVVILNQI